VVYTTDNGAELMTWPDGGSTPFRGEKATNWEGGFRVPTVIRWPGVIKPGTIYNDMFAHMDFIPTFCVGRNPLQAPGFNLVLLGVRPTFPQGTSARFLSLEGADVLARLLGT
jgi:arylsulfatase A-like enzyme